MAEYRVHFVGRDNNFKAADTIHCDTAYEVVDIAVGSIGGFAAVEVRGGGR